MYAALLTLVPSVELDSGRLHRTTVRHPLSWYFKYLRVDVRFVFALPSVQVIGKEEFALTEEEFREGELCKFAESGEADCFST